MFRFARQAIQLHGDGVGISEVVVGVVLRNLDSIQRLSQAHQAISLLKTVFEMANKQLDDLSESQVSDLRLQADQVVPTLCEIVLISEKKILMVTSSERNEAGFGETYCDVIYTLGLISGIRDWNR